MFQLPAEWAGCSVTLHIRHSDGTLAAPLVLDAAHSAPVGRSFTGWPAGQWMLAATDGSGYTAYTRPGRYDVYGILPTDGTEEEPSPSVYEQFIAQVSGQAEAAVQAAQSSAASEASAARQAQAAAVQGVALSVRVRPMAAAASWMCGGYISRLPFRVWKNQAAENASCILCRCFYALFPGASGPGLLGKPCMTVPGMTTTDHGTNGPAAVHGNVAVHAFAPFGIWPYYMLPTASRPLSFWTKCGFIRPAPGGTGSRRQAAPP